MTKTEVSLAENTYEAAIHAGKDTSKEKLEFLIECELNFIRKHNSSMCNPYFAALLHLVDTKCCCDEPLVISNHCLKCGGHVRVI